MTKRLILNAFTMATPTHLAMGQWRDPYARQFDYQDMEVWIDLVQSLERAKFDTVFFADAIGLAGPFRGNWDALIEKGIWIPATAPAVIMAALIAKTKNIGLAYTSSIIQAYPAAFARQLATLDHLSGGRVAWNIVTTSLENAHRNHSLPKLTPHDQRYERAEEYLDQMFSILEGPSPFEATGDEGKNSRAQLRPSPQRTPFLFVAGSSAKGQEFAAKYAEGLFVSATTLKQTREISDRIRQRATEHGRSGDDIKLFRSLEITVASTEAEAKRKLADIEKYADPVGSAAMMGGNLGIDFGRFDFDKPIEDKDAQGGLGPLEVMRAATPDGKLTIRSMFENYSKPLVGTPEQIADELESWAEAGLDGVNFVLTRVPYSATDFIDEVLPVLQKRGLAQTEYEEGTLRERLSGSAHVAETHPASQYRETGSRPVSEVNR